MSLEGITWDDLITLHREYIRGTDAFLHTLAYHYPRDEVGTSKGAIVSLLCESFRDVATIAGSEAKEHLLYVVDHTNRRSHMLMPLNQEIPQSPFVVRQFQERRDDDAEWKQRWTRLPGFCLFSVMCVKQGNATWEFVLFRRDAVAWMLRHPLAASKSTTCTLHDVPLLAWKVLNNRDDREHDNEWAEVTPLLLVAAFSRRQVGHKRLMADAATPPRGAPCAQCGKPAVQKCSVCTCVRYCSRQCQNLHWKRHKRYCMLASVVVVDNTDVVAVGGGDACDDGSSILVRFRGSTMSALAGIPQNDLEAYHALVDIVHDDPEYERHLLERCDGMEDAAAKCDVNSLRAHELQEFVYKTYSTKKPSA